MTSPRVDETLEYARRNWPLLSAIGAGLIFASMTFQRVNAIEEELEDADSQKERIVRIETQITTVQTSIGELKTTIKEQQTIDKEEREALEDTINDNFRQLLLELQRQRDS
jgi:hypothetical protein